MADRQQPGLSTDTPPNYRRGGGGTRKTERPARGDGGRSGLGLNVMMVLLIAGLVLAGWFIANQQQMLAEEQAELASASDRIAKLEERLMATDSALTQEGQDTQQKLGLWESEIRKLWDNVWKKQKAELAEHDTELEKYGKRLSSLESKASSNDKQLSAALQQFKKDSESRESMSSKLDRVIAQAEVNRKTLLDVNKELTAGGSLDARVKELETRMAQSEEWLDSVNAFRRQVNRELEALRQTVTQYHSGSPAP